MSDTPPRKNEAEERRRRNAELVRKVKAGEVIGPTVSLESIFFPPRPVIKKDKREMARIYGEDTEK